MEIKEIEGKKVRMLEPVFWKNGSLFSKVAEGEEYYVYEVVSCPRPKVIPTIDRILKPKSGDTGNFELFCKRIANKHPLDKCEEYEMIDAYPSTSQWGSLAWTYTQWDNVKRAIRKKFFGEPFYNQEDEEQTKKLLCSMETYN